MRETWSWMMAKDLLDQTSAVGTVDALWERKYFRSAQELWIDWIGPGHGDYPEPQKLANRAFQDTPAGGPFDWALETPASVSLSQSGGLELRFSGTENVALLAARQGTLVHSGRYQFVADVESEGITTDQCPFFHIFDAANPATLSVESRQIQGTTPRSRISVDFYVPSSTQAVIVQLERRPSERFDSKIEGRLHLYSVSLQLVGSKS